MSLCGVAWPKQLERLTFGGNFNHPIDANSGVTWPEGLRTLAFGLAFNQPLVGVQWPAKLRKLSFDGVFNQPLDRAVWPRALEELTLGWHFDQVWCSRSAKGWYSTYNTVQHSLGVGFPGGTPGVTMLEKRKVGKCDPKRKLLQRCCTSSVLHLSLRDSGMVRSGQMLADFALRRKCRISSGFKIQFHASRGPNGFLTRKTQCRLSMQATSFE